MKLPNDERPPLPRNLRIASFATHAARGLLRDRAMRRKAMFWTVIVAMVMLFCGATFLAPIIDPHLHPGWFICYWLACAWVTVTVILLALFDLLRVRAQARADKRALAQKMATPPGSDDAE